jgi:hypothetical protein
MPLQQNEDHPMVDEIAWSHSRSDCKRSIDHSPSFLPSLSPPPRRRRRDRLRSPAPWRHGTTCKNHDDLEWAVNPFNDCISHQNNCNICHRYLAHFTDAAMDGDHSLLHAVNAHQAKSHRQLGRATDNAKFYRSKALEMEDDLIKL